MTSAQEVIGCQLKMASTLFFIVTMLSAVTAQISNYGFDPQIQLAVDALADVLDRGAPISGQLWMTPKLRRPSSWFDVLGYNSDCSKEEKTCNWMAKFPDNTPLVSMNLPGTHDAATCMLRIYVVWYSLKLLQGTIPMLPKLHSFAIQDRTSPISTFNTQPLNLQNLKNSVRIPPADNYRCQEHSIVQSLNEGIRVFDLRLAYNPGNDTIGFWHCEHLFRPLPEQTKHSHGDQLRHSLHHRRDLRMCSSQSTYGSVITPVKPSSYPSTVKQTLALQMTSRFTRNSMIF